MVVAVAVAVAVALAGTGAAAVPVEEKRHGRIRTSAIEVVFIGCAFLQHINGLEWSK